MSLSVQVGHRFPAAQLDVALELPETGLSVLFGRSGAGKSTVLAAIAGLLRPDRCRVALGDVVLADTGSGVWLAPERRRIGVVFQEARLFPHMSVRGNLLFGARRATEHPIRLDEILSLLDIAGLLDRRPHTLSGGERQRVAIGRALLSQPRLLLMDEPLSSLDAERKAEIMPYLARLKTRHAMPIVYVTHALDEVQQLADFVVLLRAGTVLASGGIAGIASRADLPLARRDEAGAVLLCRVGQRDPSGLTRLQWGAIDLWAGAGGHRLGDAVRVRLPAREVILALDIKDFADRLSLHNVLPARVRAIADEPDRGAALVEVATPSGTLLARVTPDAVARLGLAPGVAVSALFKAMSLEILGRPPHKT